MSLALPVGAKSWKNASMRAIVIIPNAYFIQLKNIEFLGKCVNSLIIITNQLVFNEPQ